MTCEIKLTRHWGAYWEVRNETHVVGVIDHHPGAPLRGVLYWRTKNKCEHIGDWSDLDAAKTAMREAYFERAIELGWVAA